MFIFTPSKPHLWMFHQKWPYALSQNHLNYVALWVSKRSIESGTAVRNGVTGAGKAEATDYTLNTVWAWLCFRGIIRKNSIWDMLIFRKVQNSLGGQIRAVICGSAPLSPHVINFTRVVFGCVVCIPSSLHFSEIAAPHSKSYVCINMKLESNHRTLFWTYVSTDALRFYNFFWPHILLRSQRHIWNNLNSLF